MPLNLDKDLKTMLANSPGSVYWQSGSFSGYGILELDSAYNSNSGTIDTIRVLLVAKSDIPNPILSSSITVGGVNYKLNSFYDFAEGNQYKIVVS